MQFVGTFIGIVLLFIFSIFLYFYGYDLFKDSFILKAFCGTTIFISFIILISFLFLNIYVESDSVCKGSEIDISDREQDMAELITDSKQVHSVQWNIDFKNRNNYVLSEFCFHFNNTNSSNKLINLVYENTILTENQAFLLNGTEGTQCIEFNSSLIKNGMILGLNCDNCNSLNPLRVCQDLDSDKIMELESSSPTISYTAQLDFPHTYFLKLYQNCNYIIKDYFNFILLIMSILIAILFGIILIEKVKSFTDDVHK